EEAQDDGHARIEGGVVEALAPLGLVGAGALGRDENNQLLVLLEELHHAIDEAVVAAAVDGQRPDGFYQPAQHRVFGPLTFHRKAHVHVHDVEGGAGHNEVPVAGVRRGYHHALLNIGRHRTGL
nr:hypothetical protein [Tanacetum cinerariifolium]